MASAETRTDIRMHDVFISWTGKDRDLKDRIAAYLRQNQITVLESDHDCAGDFRLWSREAVSKCTVFLLLHTEHTLHSQYVPIEVEELKKQDDWRNRCLPVVSDYRLYAQEHPDLAESESAIVFSALDDAVLAELLRKVQLLINNRLRKVYREATQPAYLKLKSFLRMVHAQDREFNYESLYIPRTVSDESGNAICDASVFTAAEDIFFLQGPAGSGKSCYIDQLRKTSGENVLVLALPCRKLTNTSDLLQTMFEEFSRHCGNRHFFTLEDFKSLLNTDHLLLVLDGMDEIATKSGTRQFLEAVSAYYEAHAASTTLFFTGRSGDDANLIAMNGQTPRRLTLRSLDEEQIQAFGQNLFLLLEKPGKSDGFYVRVKELSDEIRTNPLLLSQLAIIYDKSGQIPETTVGIYDAVCEITLSQEENVANLPQEYRDMVLRKLPSILKAFSAERYRLLTLGKQPATVKILSAVLKSTYDDARERAEFLDQYLRDRAMLIDGEFYHKMLLEYFTAVYYYEHCFDDYDELEDPETLRELFEHYTDPYWSAVLQLFLVKADSLIDEQTTGQLYRHLLTYGITEYTLLFDTCRTLEFHAEAVRCVLLRDILLKSADGSYPPYGPLFWYVPEYGLYEPLLLALDSVPEESFTKALALVRDVCWIFGHYSTASQITDRVSGDALFARAKLPGVRQGLCQLFYTGATDAQGGEELYPRCFNLAEARHWKEHGCGVLGRMTVAFDDGLGLYSHEMYSQLDREYIGIVAAPYDRDRVEARLIQSSCKKLSGLFFSATADGCFDALAVNDKHLRMVYAPENAQSASAWRYYCVLNSGLMYFYDTVRIPDGVTEIGASAFENCTALIRITMPDSVTKIGEQAFEGCAALEKITLPAGVTTVAEKAFRNCSALTDITIPDGVTRIREAAFENCTALSQVQMPESLETIENSAFKNCSRLSQIAIPKRVAKIGWYAFGGCESLAAITLPDCLRTIEMYSFWGCKALTEIVIPTGVETVDVCAFWYCTGLQRVLLPDSVQEIGLYAFRDCTALTQITIPDGVREIRDRTFQNCTALTGIAIPNTVKSIGTDAFQSCTALTQIALPDSVQEIGKNAFGSCTALKQIRNCPAGYDHWDLGVAEDCQILARQASGNGILVIAPDTVVIAPEAYLGRRDIRKVILPDSVQEIGWGAFQSCTALEEIVLPDSLEEIGGGAFRGCSALTEITLPGSVTQIQYATFTECTSLSKITVPETVEQIGWNAFKGCTSLTEMLLPDSVQEIGESAFEKCAALKKVRLPRNITELADSTFAKCTSLATITLPDSVREIDSSVFEGCTALTEVILPDSITGLGIGVFWNCTALKDIRIPARIKEIESGVFGFTALEKITLPEQVEIIHESAFGSCTALTEITIPASVTVIKECAFAGCTSLQSITVPVGVRSIGDAAFGDCGMVRQITISRRFEDDLARIFPEMDLSKITVHWL